ncbi:MAG: ABC transporter substrate-binding protein, partial [Bilophila sp.]
MARAWLKAAVIGMALTGMTVSAQAADTLKIGVPGAHSGDLASYGLPSLNAARIVVDEFNAKGGLLGKQIEIIAQDDQCKPEMGTNAAT